MLDVRGLAASFYLRYNLVKFFHRHGWRDGEADPRRFRELDGGLHGLGRIGQVQYGNRTYGGEVFILLPALLRPPNLFFFPRLFCWKGIVRGRCNRPEHLHSVPLFSLSKPLPRRHR